MRVVVEQRERIAERELIPEELYLYKYCIYHQVHGHDTSECKVVIAQAERMRATWEASRGGFQAPKSKNKTWVKDATTNKKSVTKEDLQAMMDKAVEKMAKKRHKSNNEVQVGESFDLDDFPAINLSEDEDAISID